MKHLAKIQTEFLKEASNWNDFSIEEQKKYLKQHPKSKRKITAKPNSGKADTSIKNKLNTKKSLLKALDKIKDVGYDDEITNLKRDATDLHKMQPFDVTSTASDGFSIKFHNNIKDLSKKEQSKLRDFITAMNDPQESEEDDDGNYALSEENEKDFMNGKVSFWWDDTYATISDDDTADSDFAPEKQRSTPNPYDK